MGSTASKAGSTVKKAAKKIAKNLIWLCFLFFCCIVWCSPCLSVCCAAILCGEAMVNCFFPFDEKKTVDYLEFVGPDHDKYSDEDEQEPLAAQYDTRYQPSMHQGPG